MSNEKKPDEFHGQGGSYVVENGKRQLVERTKDRHFVMKGEERVLVPADDEPAAPVQPAAAEPPAPVENKRGK